MKWNVLLARIGIVLVQESLWSARYSVSELVAFFTYETHHRTGKPEANYVLTLQLSVRVKVSEGFLFGTSDLLPTIK